MPQPLAPQLFSLFQKQEPLFHGVFSRHGGCSPKPFSSLNVSYGVGDTPENVATNRRMIQNYFGAKSLISARQIHAKKIAIITEPQDSQELNGFDALICSVPGVAIMIQQADCQAVLLYDTVQRVVAGVHSGWQGSVANIIGETIRTMTLVFGSAPTDIIAAISPSLGPCCAEFIHYKTELPEPMHQFQTSDHHFDFWAISTTQLTDAGVLKNNIEINGTCSKCSDDFFSYRQNKETGRNCSVIGLHHG